MKRQRKTCLGILLALVMALSSTMPALAWTETATDFGPVVSALDPENNEVARTVRERIDSGALDVKVGSAWTICVYLCGSDLESGNGNATRDVLEIPL